MSNYDYVCFNGLFYNMKYVTAIGCDNLNCTMTSTPYIYKSPKEKVFKCNLDDYLKYGCVKNNHDDKNEKLTQITPYAKG